MQRPSNRGPAPASAAATDEYPSVRPTCRRSSGTARTAQSASDALLKSYSELERKLGGPARRIRRRRSTKPPRGDCRQSKPNRQRRTGYAIVSRTS